MSVERIKQMTDQIGKALAEEYDRTNPDEVSGKIQEFSALLALSSEAYALAEMVYSQKLMEIVEQYQTSMLSATDKKYILAGKAKEEARYVTLTERYNKALTHSLDGLRSILSALKTDLLNSKYQTT